MTRARIGALATTAVVCAMAVMATSALAQTANRAPRITTAAATPAAGYGAPLTVAFSAAATDAVTRRYFAGAEALAWKGVKA